MMSGTIEVSPRARWSASSWLFDWTIEYLAATASDHEAAAAMRDAIIENLGWISLNDFSRETKAELMRILTMDLVKHAEQALPTSLAQRSEAIELLRDLAEQTAKASSTGETP